MSERSKKDRDEIAQIFSELLAAQAAEAAKKPAPPAWRGTVKTMLAALGIVAPAGAAVLVAYLQFVPAEDAEPATRIDDVWLDLQNPIGIYCTAKPEPDKCESELHRRLLPVIEKYRAREKSLAP